MGGGFILPCRMKMILRILMTVAVVVVVPLVVLVACQSKMIYLPRPYPGNPPMLPESFLKAGGREIEIRTGEGRQVGWLRLPAGGKPERFWIVCGGNGTLALELAGHFPESDATRDAWLFFDYPGYGYCQGKPSPMTIGESLRAVVPAALAECGMTPEDLPERGIVLGHSLGAAVALMAADAFEIRRAVLISPFTSTPDMARKMLGLPVGWLVTHRFDNRAMLDCLVERGGRAWIIHGKADRIIPVTMGRELAAAHPDKIRFFEIPNAGHNDIFQRADSEFHTATAEARNP